VKLDVANLSYAYHGHAVLAGVDFSADGGQCVCVLGENGAGKTTLFRCLLRLLGDYRGDVLLDGADSRQFSARQLARKISYVPQAYVPTFDYSVFDTVLMGTSVVANGFRTPGRGQNRLAGEMLELLGISALADRGFAELSGGERQLVLVARALAQQSPVIVMDEPTANLDYGNQFRVMAQVKRLAGQGYLVVMSTHNPELALLYADEVVVLRDGKADLCGEPGTVLTPDAIEAIYGVGAELHDVSTSWGHVPVLVPRVG